MTTRNTASSLLLLGAAAASLAACAAPSPAHHHPAPAVTVTATASPVAAPSHSTRLQRTAAAIGRWHNGPGGRAEVALGKALGSFSKSASSGNVAATGASCALVGKAVARAQAAPPFPDAKAERYYAMALSKYQVAASECADGAATYDAAILREADVNITAGTRYLSKSLARIRVINAAIGG